MGFVDGIELGETDGCTDNEGVPLGILANDGPSLMEGDMLGFAEGDSESLGEILTGLFDGEDEGDSLGSLDGDGAGPLEGSDD